MDKDKQLSALAQKCRELPVYIRCSSGHPSVTVSIPPPWNAVTEIEALKTQSKIKDLSKEYPDVIVYCFDSFSTLLYVV